MKTHFALLIALVSACATPHVLRPGELQPLTAQVSPDQRAVMWQRAISALLDEGYVPTVMNEAAGYVGAKQRDDVSVGALAGTMAIVTISPEGVVRVEVSGAGLYTSDSALVADVSKVQQQLMQEIMARAPAAPPPTPAS
jgi:hypothetical protein